MSELALTRLADYQPPDFTTLSHVLRVVLDDGEAEIHHQQRFVRQGASNAALVLDGEALTVQSLAIDGVALESTAWQYDGKQLIITDVPDAFALKSVVHVDADGNKELSGLYRSNGIYCTQCEAQGFRRISFALDRPDVLATYDVRIEADQARCPVLLSNGDLIDQGMLDNGRHYAHWHDPHPKPSYLFAVVAGDLAEAQRSVTTPHGNELDLCIYTEAAFIEQTDFAMDSLVHAIEWDETRFDLDYDLTRFNIVAISDFNMGAMENKSLNVFNTRFVLGDTATATDQDFQGIESVIGHEYFHNWTGNRITCRDWFQLSLKEGLTVFRDQEFSADRGEAALERIANVNMLRRVQFAEDAGPLAHPVQPQAYAAIDNFYTATVYEKGAEIIRMYHTIIGEEAFQAGMRLYVQRHDGQAVRIEDFAACMSEASGFPFDGDFFRWYTHQGTPRVVFSSHYDEASRCLTLRAEQQTEKVKPQAALVIPVVFSLLNKAGEVYRFSDEAASDLWVLEEAVEERVIHDIDGEWLPVWLHGFSAPIYYDYGYQHADLAHIVAHADDGFARVEAMQTLYRRLFNAAYQQDEATYQTLISATSAVMGNALASDARSAGEKALLLSIPATASLINALATPWDMDAVLGAEIRLRHDLSSMLAEQADAYLQQDDTSTDSAYSAADAQIRQLRAVLLAHLAEADSGQWRARFTGAYEQARNMSERMAALHALNVRHDAAREAALADFAERFADYPLVLDKYYALQASAKDEGALARINALSEREGFVISNPNRFRALVGAFAQNLTLFHAPDGSGYRFVIGQIRRIVTLNPQLAARMLNTFAVAAQLDSSRQGLMTGELNSLLEVDGISTDVREVIERILGGL
ncbi:aminopeptidase N [Suttonella sp. R2A3]|uniref:aminopeptidase N n=1 Tax=Suttonella sp. R2A3 TaxID=2908648 RepID=UPI001F44E989|nr:aminopeptidase N [Suttonella sp. R2A3]UJF25407.1 aminopeptidase N [Suttonella sp. R2A3]